jgi:hypothetical protein
MTAYKKKCVYISRKSNIHQIEMIQRKHEDLFAMMSIIVTFGTSRIKVKSQMSMSLFMVEICILLLLILSVFIHISSAQIFPKPQTHDTSTTNNNNTKVTKQITVSSHPASQQQSKSNLHLVKIISPIKGQHVTVSKNLLIYGTSEDNTTSDCKVSIIVNGVKPYHLAVPNGEAGPNDYSKWNFTLIPAYTHIELGQNKITSKFYCSNDPNLRSYNSVNVTGVTTNYNINRSLMASIHVTEGSAHPGDKQTITFKVNDTNSNNTIAGASVIGNITDPSGIFYKKLQGVTNDKGKFAYSYEVGKRDKSGKYEVVMKVSAPGYVNQSASKTYKVTASLASSKNILIPLNVAGSNNSGNSHTPPSTIIDIPFK